MFSWHDNPDQAQRQLGRDERDRDPIGLLLEIRKVAFGDNEVTTGSRVAKMQLNVERLDKSRQGRHESDEAFLRRFNQEVDVCETSGYSFVQESLVDEELAAIQVTRDPDFHLLPEEEQRAVEEEEQDMARTAAREKRLVHMYFSKISKERFGRMLEELHNDSSVGFDRYPTTMQLAYNMVCARRDDPRNITELMSVDTAIAFFTQLQKKSSRTRFPPRLQRRTSRKETATRAVGRISPTHNNAGSVASMDTQSQIVQTRRRPKETQLVKRFLMLDRQKKGCSCLAHGEGGYRHRRS